MPRPSLPPMLRQTDGGGTPGLAYGADYNPDQWPREVWDEDVRLMREAGVTVVSLAIFSWARIQPAEDVWDFGWLDEVMDLLHAGGIAVDLATATASPPPWLTAAHPEVLPVTRSGETVWPGARQHWRPTSPVFREYALRLVAALAERYRDHPALVAWHVNNELGCHNVYDHSDDAARAFRAWLRSRYGTLEALNHAWGTAFWSQRYTDWEQILPPRLAASHLNPTQQLDFKRFSSDALRDHLRAERDVLRRIAPGVPVTTNFMVMGGTRGMNYADWAREVDFVSNDHYVVPGPQALDELSFSANLTGNIAGGRPWFLMEHSTSAVNWQPVNRAKRDGELARDSLLHVAHGADAVCFFQWRQSAAGAEKYHSAMVPHAGPDSDVFRSVTGLGRVLRDLAPVAGSERAPAPAAILFDWESWWACEQDSHPTSRLRYRQEALDWYSAFLALGVRADVVPAGTELDGYGLVVAPVLHMVPGELARKLTGYVEGGGHLVTTYFSGIVDENDHVWLGGYPGPLRDLLGIRVEEFAPLDDGEGVALDDGATGTLWTDRITLTDPAVEVLASYRTGDQAGRPAITRRRVGGGSAAYVSTRLGADGLTGVLARLLDAAGIAGELPSGVRGRVELAVREGGGAAYWFLVNRTDETVELPGVTGEVLAGRTEGGADGVLVLAPRGVAVLRRAASPAGGAEEGEGAGEGEETGEGSR
ncbi:beta-galactosidase [Streptomyces glaucosporus]|uniref:Beta-galactosidase n=1 Tax=Streptomyces glaucosporus TaxID=284044 RepID=A0ABP5VJ40_9ACTN